MSAATDFAALYRLPPSEAVEFLHRRDKVTVTYDWRDLWQEEHARQFTVSRLTALDVLEAVRQGITDSVQGDLSRRDFMTNFEEYLARKGWWGERVVLDPVTGEAVTTKFDPARLKLIYDTNTRQAYSAGQWERIERNKASHPYIRYITQRDEKVREEHREWDNLTLPVDDPFWRSHYPPNGWNCRCRVVAVSRRDYEKGRTPTGQQMGKTAPTVEMRDWENKRTGETLSVPKGIDPGFAYNPGQARAADLARLTHDKLQQAAPEAAAEALAAIVAGPGFARWYDAPQGNHPLVVIPADDAREIGARGTVADLSASTARKQKGAHPELTPQEYALAQQVIDHPTARVKDGKASIIYVREAPSDDAGGYVLVVKATKTGAGLFVTSYRRLSRAEALRDTEVARLLRKAEKK